MFPFNLRRAAPGSTQIIPRSLAIWFLLLAQNIGTRNYPHQRSAWVAAFVYQHPSILAQVFWPFCEADGWQRDRGAQLQCWEPRCWGGRRETRSEPRCSGWLTQAGPTRSWKATRLAGQSLIGKQQRFVSTAIYVSSAWQAVSASEGR